MRILVYGDIGGSSGYARYCKGLFGSGSIPDGCEVHFVCSTQFFRQLEPLDAEVNVIAHRWPSSSSLAQRYLWHLWIYPRLVNRIRPHVEFYPLGHLRMFGRRAKAVATCHNLLLFDPKEMDRFGDSRVQRHLSGHRSRVIRSFKRASGVIFLSGHSQATVQEQVPGIKLATIIPHGVEPKFLMAGKRSYLLGAEVNVLYVSSILPYKNHLVAVRAVKELREITGRDVRLRIVGAADKENLKHLERDIVAEEASGFVTVAGEKNDQGLLDEYRRADIFVFASSCECFPNILLEAMGARLPIACSDRVGLPEILKDSSLYFDPENPPSLIAALKQFLEDESRRRWSGEKAFQYVQPYTWERCARSTFAFLSGVAEENRRRSTSNSLDSHAAAS